MRCPRSLSIRAVIRPHGAVTQLAQLNPLRVPPPHAAPAGEVDPRLPVSTLTAVKARSTRGEPQASHRGFAPSA